MNTRVRCDVVVVGAGVVGSACALALAQQGLDVAIVEAREPPRWYATPRGLRVFAFAPDNMQLLQSLDAWHDIASARAHPYRRMSVWDAAGGGDLVFDADALGRRQLGWIIENALLVDRLWSRLQKSGVQMFCPATLAHFEQGDDGVRVQLEDGTRLDAKLAVAADGAASALRTGAGIDIDAHDYAQRGVVGYVRTELPHQDTAWQRFLPSGPLAFLPCSDGLSSIVWSLPTAQAERVLGLDDAEFARELTRAFDARLGQVEVASPRAAFPLRRQLARQLHRGRIVLVGDAAHVVHPLAGQGVNLGLRDVAALRDSIADARQRKCDPFAAARLQRWARVRISDNTVSAHAFETINRAFSNDAVLPVLVRGRLLGLAGKVPPLTRALWRHAAGI